MGRYLGEAAVTQQPSATGPYEEAAKYVFKKQLAAAGDAGDHFTDLLQFIDKDSDFELTDIAAVSDGNFSLNIKNPGGRFLFSSEAQAPNVCGTGQFPVPVVPSLVYVAGSKIGVSLTNLDDGINNVELVFSGVKRYPTA